jgi:nickel/cobalt transporter (NicO) family protein
MSRARFGLCVAVATAFVVAAPPSVAAAHPLGNFSVNHLSQVRVSEGAAELHYIRDQAEVPTFQEVQRFDGDGSGAIEGPERAPLLERKLGEIGSDIELVADGRRVPLGPPRDATLEFPPGQGGLVTARVEATFDVEQPPGVRRLELEDNTYGDRVGWKAIQVVPGEGVDVESSVPATDPTDGLRAYPEDLLESPFDQRSATFKVSEGTGEVTAPTGPDGGPTTTNRALDGFAATLTSADTGGLLIVLLLAAAFGWGALHALSPGHGKAMVAGYLVGSRGTARDAVILGATVTVTHTIAVFALGLVTLLASQYLLPEDLYPWLGVVSGAMVVTIGLAVMRSRYRRWRALRSGGHNGHSHQHRLDRGHDHDHDHGHDHHAHSHVPDEPITMRGLLALGVSGGLVPCPSALVVLIGAISQHRVGLGMVLILAFSLGLAATLTATGLAVVYGGRVVARLRPERRLFGARFAGALPAVSATLIVLAGTLITIRALPEVG